MQIKSLGEQTVDRPDTKVDRREAEERMKFLGLGYNGMGF
jgi:hypothetical protein